MKFDTNAFSFLNDDNQYTHGWNNVTHEELKLTLEYLIAQGFGREDAPNVFAVIEAFNAFMDSIGLSDTTDPVMGVKIDEGGLLEQVNGPAIFASDAGPVLKVGNYKIPITINGDKASVASLKGDIVVAENGDKDKYRSVTWEFFSEVLGDNIEVSFVLDSKQRPEIAKLSKGKLKQIVNEGGLTDLLRAISSDGSFLKPRDLDVGEYSVVSITRNKDHAEYGPSWKIVLEGVGPMMTTGHLNNSLLTMAGIYTKWLSMGKPLTFAISGKTKTPQGVAVSCGFFKRPPNPTRLVTSAKMMEIAAEPTAPALPQSATSTVTVPAVAVPAVAVQSGLEIPF